MAIVVSLEIYLERQFAKTIVDQFADPFDHDVLFIWSGDAWATEGEIFVNAELHHSTGIFAFGRFLTGPIRGFLEDGGDLRLLREPLLLRIFSDSFHRCHFQLVDVQDASFHRFCLGDRSRFHRLDGIPIRDQIESILVCHYITTRRRGCARCSLHSHHAIPRSSLGFRTG